MAPSEQDRQQNESDKITEIKADLRTRISSYVRSWEKQKWLYAGLSLIFRIFLITLTAIVAAQKSAEAIWKTWPRLNGMFLILSVGAAILTALDSWLKPRDKWRGFMKVYDDGAGILDQVTETPKDKTADLLGLRDKFDALLEYHRQHNVF